MIEGHLLHLARLNRRPGSIRAREWCLHRAVRFIAKPLLDATVDDLRAFVGRGLAAETRAAEVSHLRGFYQWALAEGLIDTDPTVPLELVKA